MRKGEINNPLSPHLELEEDDQEPLSSVSKETENEDTFNTSRYTAPIKIGNAAPPDTPPSGHNPHNSETINFFQKTYGNLATLRYYNYPHPVQAKLKAGQPGDIYEREADRAAEQITGSGSAESVDLSGIGPGIQLAPAETSPPSTPATTSAAETAQTSSTAVASVTTPTPGLIVDDSVKKPETWQMKKKAFLSQLRTAVYLTVESALVGTDRTAADCPWIGYWFGFYKSRSSRQIERDILRYAPEASGVTSAKDYIPIICARVRRGVDTWKTTGKITGVPEGISTGLPDTDGGLFSGIAGAVGNMLFKARDGGAKEGADPRAIRSRLGSGSPLDSGVRSKVESVFGKDLSAVRVHTDSGAARLSDGLNARAFTIGSDIAFGGGEYKPGTLIGDALIAHELAHVVQQGGGSASSAPMQKGETGHGPLEEEADMSAVGAVASIWGGIKGGVANIAKNAVPRLRSGLKLQRCSKVEEWLGYNTPIRIPSKPLKPVSPNKGGLHFFERYKNMFNFLWNIKPYKKMPPSYDSSLSSKGPRTPKSREIFLHLYETFPWVKDAYNLNSGGIRKLIDTYTKPEGLNLINSPRLEALQKTFASFSPPIDAANYSAFRTAVQNAAKNLPKEDIDAVKYSNEWRRLINSYVTNKDQRADILAVIIARPITSQKILAEFIAYWTLAEFIANWTPVISYLDESKLKFNKWGPEKNVKYYAGRLDFLVMASSSKKNPGRVMYVTARILRGSEVIKSSKKPEQFPMDQREMLLMKMTVNAPKPFPKAGDALLFEVQLLDADRETLLNSGRISINVKFQDTFTKAQAEAAATEDDKYLNNNLLKKMVARKGIAANVATAIRKGEITLRPLTQRHDSSRYVKDHSTKKHDSSTDVKDDFQKVGYFYGTSYAKSIINDHGTGGFRLLKEGSGYIVVMRTTNVATGEKRDDDDVIVAVVHEAIHAMVAPPSAEKYLERYKDEFRAYWMSGQFGPPNSGVCPSSSKNCEKTSYDPTLPPPGPKSERARAIFNQLYYGYPFVKPAYDNNVNGFREAVDNYLIPDGINLIVSIRLERLQAYIGNYWFEEDFIGFMMSVKRQMEDMTEDERDEIRRNRAWRDLVERKITIKTHQEEIKTIMGIPYGSYQFVSIRLGELRSCIISYANGWFDFDELYSNVWSLRSDMSEDEWNEINTNRVWRDLVEREITDELEQSMIKNIMFIIPPRLFFLNRLPGETQTP